MEEIIKRIDKAFAESANVRKRLFESPSHVEVLAQMAASMITIYRNGGKLLIAGNGGSAADAQHFAAEITCQYMVKRKARPAIALHTDTSALTAWGNDYSYESAFTRLLEAHGNAGDGIVLITTSGNSRNLVAAAERARELGIRTFGLLGRDGGTLVERGLCDETVIVPSSETPRIQECHVMVIHMLCEELDRAFLEEDESK